MKTVLAEIKALERKLAAKKDLGLTERNPAAVLIVEAVKELGNRFSDEPEDTKRRYLQTLDLAIRANTNKQNDEVKYTLKNELLGGVVLTVRGFRKNEKHGKTKLLEDQTFKSLFGHLY